MNIQQQSGQTPMKFAQPPAILSTKDFLYIEDILSWNLEIIKKANAYASLCQDQDVIQAMNRTCQLHMRHYQSILNHLGKHVQATTMAGGMAQ
ncbi:hypothetical protein NIE88_16140 [Sporolactobacillus shoreicorticis]|uniref:Spore coat protein n=1 Tax=Sporolactobacillus shoreicorticis TaxID=1923877 RepID=A0ABW5S914_9BACL|nr:hypothetical protein [Sporolactobacillus shoreicorticis]MCO7127300.1 hypothetical protein [Sporolactobacillus shoreicorticis]